MVNQFYQKKEVIAQIKEAFAQNSDLPSISLQKFLPEEKYAQIIAEIKKAKWEKKTHKLRYSYQKAKTPSSLQLVLTSKEFITLLEGITKKKAGKIKGELLSFGWKDYTLLNDWEVEKSGIDIILDFTEEWGEGCGGAAIYVDGSGQFHKTLIEKNTLTLTQRKKGVQKFVQYLNHFAGKRRRILFVGTIE